MDKHKINWRGLRTDLRPIDIDNAVEIYLKLDGKVARLILAYPDVEIKGKPENLTLVVRSRFPLPDSLYLTDTCSVAEWGQGE